MSGNRRCLIVGPLAKEFQPVRAVISEALKSNGIDPVFFEDLAPGATINESIQREMERTDFVIADLTNANPNVVYEVGMAHGLKKPVLPIVQRETRQLPSYLGGYLYLVYDLGDLNSLRDQILKWSSREYAMA